MFLKLKTLMQMLEKKVTKRNTIFDHLSA